MNHGDGDHHDEQIDGDGDLKVQWAIPSHICVYAVLTMFYFHVR